jgi:hypothetical protein
MRPSTIGDCGNDFGVGFAGAVERLEQDVCHEGAAAAADGGIT